MSSTQASDKLLDVVRNMLEAQKIPDNRPPEALHASLVPGVIRSSFDPGSLEINHEKV